MKNPVAEATKLVPKNTKHRRTEGPYEEKLVTTAASNSPARAGKMNDLRQKNRKLIELNDPDGTLH